MKRLLGLFVLASCSAPQQAPQAPPELPAQERVAACLAAMDAKSTRETVVACRQLWRDSTCQDAWLASLDALRGDRAKVILAGCLPAYCAPALQICSWDPNTADLSADSPDWLAGWVELNREVLPRELDGQVEGPEAGEFAKQLLILVTLNR